MTEILSRLPQRIFITGASGCIGHYVVEALVEQTEHELFLLLRNPDKLQVDITQRPGIHVIQGDLHNVEGFANLLSTIDTAILIATCWGGANEIFEINVQANLRLMALLDPDRCRQVIYFSTSSILDRQNQPLPEAQTIGTDYIRSKYMCHQKLSELAIAPRITTLFPTLVFGGDDRKPYSHISAGLPEVANWMRLIRFFQADGSFHFIHAKDIATVVAYLVEHPSGQPCELVLGNPAVSANQAVEVISRYLNQPVYFRIPLSMALADVLIKVFRLRVAAWDRFCIQYRHFTHQNPVTPASFGLTTYCTTLADLMRATGIESPLAASDPATAPR
ncbi:MAG: NAD(P)-dependent oxidoreductase [Leptolyngbya sp. SIO4C1]|nr:NAD(P)-dependent oxidoreductase [Leptolyngbya sp. SIO4C1]